MTLKPFYWIHGDEPYLVQEAVLNLWKKAQYLGFSKRFYDTQVSFQWDQLEAAQQSGDLFEPRLFVHLQWLSPKLEREAEKALEAYMAHQHADCCLVISSARLSATIQKHALFKTIEKTDGVIPIWPLKAAQWPRWIQQKAYDKSLSLSREAIALLCMRHEGNLFSAVQAIDRLSLLGEKADANDVERDAVNGAQYKVFDLIDTVLNQDPKAVLMSVSLKQQGQELLPLLGALMKQFDTLFKLHAAQQQGKTLSESCSALGIWPKQIPLFSKAFKNIPYAELTQCLSMGLKIDGYIKSFQLALAWNQWEQLLGDLCTVS